MATNFGKQFYVEDLAEFLRLPDFEEVEELNWDFVGEYRDSARRAARQDGLSGRALEEAEQEGEQAATDELYGKWRSAVESVAESLLDEHGLLLDEKARGQYRLKPDTSWRDAVDKIVNTINGVGYFYFDSTQEFLDSGLYTPKVAVIEHLHHITSYLGRVQTASARQLYERAF